MPALIDALSFPYDRILLQRTRLAYVHVPHLLTDAKRDRAARIFGYVAIWLPEEMVILYLQEGEVVNATRTRAEGTEAMAIAEALAAVPTEPELGEICFHECADEQLACMFHTLTAPPEPWPDELKPGDRAALLPYLMSTTFDGTVEVRAGGLVNYLIVRDGEVERAFVVGHNTAARPREVVDKLFAGYPAGGLTVRRWAIPPALPVQASPGLIRGYREVANSLVKRLGEQGQESAAAIAEQARKKLLPDHPALRNFAIGERPMRDPTDDADLVTTAIAVWLSEIIWAGMDQAELTPEALLADVTRERRHMFQSAGFFDRLPWTVEW
jgi:hypothetical protein